MRHRSIALPLAALALFAAASLAVAGGWAQVGAPTVPVDPPAGEATVIELRMLQHGVTPVSWPDLTVVATDAASGAVVRVKAQAKAGGPEGSYVATIVFPTAGAWNLTFESVDLVMEGAVPMRVAPPLAAAPAGGGSPAGAPAAQAVDLLPFVVLLFAIGAALVIGGVALRGRGASAGARASARS